MARTGSYLPVPSSEPDQGRSPGAGAGADGTETTWAELRKISPRAAVGQFIDLRVETRPVPQFRWACDVYDKAGDVGRLAFHLEGQGAEGGMPPVPGLGPGAVVRWRNPRFHTFLDDTTGGRIEDADLPYMRVVRYVGEPDTAPPAPPAPPAPADDPSSPRASPSPSPSPKAGPALRARAGAAAKAPPKAEAPPKAKAASGSGGAVGQLPESWVEGVLPYVVPFALFVVACLVYFLRRATQWKA
ncbi:hypothetical protein HYH03_004292 [Edaphochlamys debaryana]|uniref:Uncharacterized protein n=1 Tax=Edaphochlamys debaryana TaxID=47281 RepID=A0A836C273_9CHLO|nr:hypothetical protein HYH03_004292 [Edaphochlamys debaryana]|eukprot:KAG2497545.1 hypothetical protein HYH03_004292 [Edaphochlamys debaryana]